MSLLQARRITMASIKLKTYPDFAKTLIEAAYRVEVGARDKVFEESPKMAAVFDKVANWLVDPTKDGLVLSGICGNGKTTMIRAIKAIYGAYNVPDGYGGKVYLRVVSARDLARMDSNGLEDLAKERFLAVDDLGTEPVEVVQYGNIFEPFKQVFEKRYDQRMATILSTNIETKDIRPIYGDRIADRFNEMMTTVVFPDRTYR